MIFSTRPGRSQTNCIPFLCKGRERKPAATEKPHPTRRTPAPVGLPIISPWKNRPERLPSLIRKKNAPEVRRTCFILYNRPSPVKLRMILHLCISSLLHQRIRPWKSRWPEIWSNSRRRRNRSERLPESRCQLPHIQQKARSRPEKIYRGTPESPGSLLRTDLPAACARIVRPQ